VIGAIFRRVWSWGVRRRELERAAWDAEFMAWKRAHPDRCVYCAYTSWANVRRTRLRLEPHACVEGNSPPDLPMARVIS
jgi:hypothetical protein